MQWYLHRLRRFVLAALMGKGLKCSSNIGRRLARRAMYFDQNADHWLKLQNSPRCMCRVVEGFVLGILDARSVAVGSYPRCAALGPLSPRGPHLYDNELICLHLYDNAFG